MSNILVTGGLGFIGHKVVNYLENQDHNVIIIDNVMHYDLVDSKQHNEIIAKRKKLVKSHNIYYTSINDEWATVGIITKHYPDTVVHLASAPNQRVFAQDKTQAISTMSNGLVNVLEACKKTKVKRFVFVSSSMVYGSFNSPIDETAKLEPANAYGIFKLTGEMLVKNACKDQMDYTIVRPSGVYGPGDLPYRVIAQFVKGALTNDTMVVKGRSQKVDFTHVDDAARGIVSASLNDIAANKTYNIATGNAISLIDAAMFCVKETGKGVINIQDQDSDQPTRHALDCSLAQQDLSYQPQIDFYSGVRGYMQWYKETYL